MKLGLNFRLNNNYLPLEYRRKFMSFIKNAFQKGDEEIYNKLYTNEEENNTVKPFTFSVYLPNADFTSEKGKVILDNNSIYLNFSTYFYNLGVPFYNGALNHLHKAYDISNNLNMTLEKINLQRSDKFDTNTVNFTTHSPIVVREHNETANKEKYYTAQEDKFIPQLKHNLTESCEHFLFNGQEKERIYNMIDNMKIEGLDMETITIMHYNHPVKGNSGRIKIKAHPKLLEYLYKSGIGSRRSQGFGKLEVVG